MNKKCIVCNSESPVISKFLNICRKCLLKADIDSLMNKHSEFRKTLRLPENPPREDIGKLCRICVNECIITKGKIGYCGVRINREGFIETVAGKNRILAYMYLDPIPTNCVAARYCPATTGAGFPSFAVDPRGEIGYFNLAVFMYGCNLDCIYCQNIQHKYDLMNPNYISKNVVMENDFVTRSLDKRVTCLCFFGGDPTPQLPEIIFLVKKVVDYAKRNNQVKRICWETNGLADPYLMKIMGMLSLKTGGIIKIDFKAWSPPIYTAITGIDGEKALKRIKENLKLLVEISKEREEIPLITISILLVPGYVNEEEVEGIAKYIVSLDENIPLVLLAFYPHHLMKDLPTTSFSHANKCFEIAIKSGLKNVSLGNEWLLSDSTY